MKRLTILLSPLMLAAALSGLATTAPTAQAQAPGARAYAPERLWELPVADQRRVIDLEYREQSSGRNTPDDQMRFYLDQVRLSRWTFSQVKSDIAQSLGGNDGGGGDLPDGGGESIRCESTDNRQKNCTTPWQSMSRLVRQLSRTPCVAGQTWSSSRGQVWVNGGCRAEFAPLVDNAGGEIRCESTDSRPRSCATPWTGGSELLRQLSGTHCVAGQNWSSSRGEIRVSGGCRGVFVAMMESSPQEIRCESTDGRYKQCAAGLYGTPTLIRQLSDTPCRANQTFGLRDGVLWVDRGCRGTFRIDGNGAGGYSVTCSSADGRYTACAWDHSRGVPVLLQTLSDRHCTQGYSWGYNRRASLWVNHGCRARFGLR